MAEAEERSSSRKSRRFNVGWVSRILLPGRRILPARTRDVSLGGVGFVLKESIPVGQEVNIELSPLVKGKQYTIRAKGNITFNMIMSGDGGFSHGLRFTLIPKDQFASLQEVLRSLE